MIEQLLVQVSHYGNTFWLVVASILIVCTRLYFLNQFNRIILAISTVASYPISLFLKSLFKVQRPLGADLTQLINTYDIYSFPSSHVLFYTVFWGYVFYTFNLVSGVGKIEKRTWSILSILLVVTIGVSRIYLGMHTLDDVTAGYGVGILLLSGIILADKYFICENSKKNK